MQGSVDGRLPLVAILRGLEPDRATEVGSVLIEAGFDIIEVPLNSPDAFASIAALVTAFGDRALIGAGTVLSVDEVDRVRAVGARLVVSPNCNQSVIAHAARHELVALPGALTPTEMFAAIAAGASGLKLFPAEMVSVPAVRAVRAVLPAQIPLLAVGGIDIAGMADYLAAGVTGFGIGGALFRPGKATEDIARDAGEFVRAFRRLSGRLN